MSSDIAIKVSNLSKCYQMYDKPSDRLKQFIVPRLGGILPPFRKLYSRHQSPLPTYYRDFWALKDVSFEVKRGETFGIIGRNGSGKSTLLQMICGTLNPTVGDIQTNGRIAALLELGAGFNPEFTGRENVYMNATVLGLSTAEIDARYDDIAAFADIGEFMEQPVKTYSSGMYVRLAFSVAINVEPQILIVDEALAVGDEPFQRKCYSRIERIRDSGATIVLVTHAGATITQMCSRALVLDHGRRLFVGNPKSAVESYYRLIYASASEAENIVEELRQCDEEEEKRGLRAQSDSSAAQGISRSETSGGKGSCSSKYSASERFDPGLRPVSTMNYESIGARISDIHIENKQGQVVNVLGPGEQYFYCYKVSFDRAAEHVHFGMLVKTTTGNDLGALGSHPFGQSIAKVHSGAQYFVRFPFINVFSPGTYFMNAGCSAAINGNEQFLHRVIDAIAFRVEHTRAGLRYAGPLQISSGDPCISLANDICSTETVAVEL